MDPTTKRLHGYVKGIDRANREFRAVLTRQEIDGDGDVVLASGVQWNRFRHNPQLLYQHDRDNPVGKWLPETLRMEQVDGQPAWTCVGRLLPPGVRKEADEAHGILVNGTLAVSIGFAPLEIAPAFLPGQKGLTFSGVEIFEASLVTIPSCAGAVVLEKSSRDEEVSDSDAKAVLRSIVGEAVGHAVMRLTGRVSDHVISLKDEHALDLDDIHDPAIRDLVAEAVAEMAPKAAPRTPLGPTAL